MGIDTMATSKGNGLTVGAGQAQQWQTFVNGQELGDRSTEPDAASVVIDWLVDRFGLWNASTCFNNFEYEIR